MNIQLSNKNSNLNVLKLFNKYKTNFVYKVFNSIADKYDLMNDLLSFGIHRFWKHFTIAASDIRPHQNILDIAGGTGDLAAKFSKIVGNKGKVILADINDSMLKIGRDKLRNMGIISNIYYIQTNVEELPFIDNYFDCVCIAFGLRNVTNQNKALKSIYRVLKPGGYLLILDFSKPTFGSILKFIYNAYCFNILPCIGQIVANDADSYRYLAESIQIHPNQKILKTMLEVVGFELVSYINLTGGIVALHKGYKF